MAWEHGAFDELIIGKLADRGSEFFLSLFLLSWLPHPESAGRLTRVRYRLDERPMHKPAQRCRHGVRDVNIQTDRSCQSGND